MKNIEYLLVLVLFKIVISPNFRVLNLNICFESWVKGNNLISIIMKFQVKKNEENDRWEDSWRKETKV